MKFEEFHPLLASTINAIATEYGRKGHWYGASHEDFAQEMVAWLLARQADIGRRFAEDTEEATRYAAKCLRNECKDYLTTMKAQASGDRGSQYDYERDEIKALLPAFFDRADSESLPEHVLDAMADFKRVFNDLPAYDRGVLEAFYWSDYSNKLLAEMHGVSEATMSYRHNRAVLRLQKLLGSTESGRDPFKGRRAVSNAAARARTNNQYEDGVSA